MSQNPLYRRADPSARGRPRPTAPEVRAGLVFSASPGFHRQIGDQLGVRLPNGVKIRFEATDAAAESALQGVSGDLITQLEPSVPRVELQLGARGRAMLQGVAIASQNLIESGGAFSMSQVRQILGDISRQRVDARVKEFSLLAVPGPNNRRMFPVVQFQDDGKLLPGLIEVLQALPTRNGWAALNFLVQPNDMLDGRSPYAHLRQGHIDRVVAAARQLGEQGH